MADRRISVTDGTRVLTADGLAIVTRTAAMGVYVRSASGDTQHISWAEFHLAASQLVGHVPVVGHSFAQLFSCLTKEATQTFLFRLEVVNELTTGFKDGFPDLARTGEPRRPFDDPTVSKWKKCNAMATVLAEEFAVNRERQRRIAEGEIVDRSPGPGTIRNWWDRFESDGFVGLIDGRAISTADRWEALGTTFREAATRVVVQLDGDISAVNHDEIERRINLRLKHEGVDVTTLSKNLRKEYIALLIADQGRTTRQQRSAALKRASGYKHYPAIRPGQVVAIDATRIDNLVVDVHSGRVISVEVLTAIDVATRVVLAMRVTPRSADGLDAGLILYDVMRPFAMLVSGTEVTDWRWSGIPEAVDVRASWNRIGHRWLPPDYSTLDGEHRIPSVQPDAIRCDHGSIFLSMEFRHLLRVHGIDLLLSRGKKPTDNPHIERWHETIQRAVQQLPGYKGRNTSERGRLVELEPLLTAWELEHFLHKWIALDYHRTWHRGIVLPGDPSARLTPLELWDSYLDVTGRIDVPQSPDLIYEFLPIHWAKIRHDGVDLLNLTFDSPDLNPYRSALAPGANAEGQHAFHVDRHDLSRIWFRVPETGRIVPVLWRGADKLQAPMTDVMVRGAQARIRQRGGNTVLAKGSATALILEQLGELAETRDPRWRNRLSASRLREQQSRRDHAEALAAQSQVQHATVPAELPSSNPADEWPQLTYSEVDW